MPATFDYPNLVVILQPGKSTLDVEVDLYSDWKESQLLSDNMKYPPLFAAGTGTDGGNIISGILENGTYFFFANDKGWRIRPPEEDINITVFGNLIGAASSLPILIPTIGNFTVLVNGIQPITQNIAADDLVHASFNNGVTLDAINGTTLASGATGNSRLPVNNFVDAKATASARGLENIFVVGAFTFGASDVLSNLSITGISAITANMITLTPGVITQNTKFKSCVITGTLNGRIDAEGVIFGAVVDMAYDSWLLDCWFEADITLKGGGSFAAINCGSTTPPGTTARPTLDYAQVSDAKSNFLRWSGNIGFKNVSAGNIELNIGSGKVFLESTNTGGTILIRSRHPDIDDETPIGGMQVISELLRFAVIADAGNTATTFKTNLTSTQTDLLKDSIIQVLPTIAAAGLAGEVKKVLSYNATTKFLTLTSALSGIPAAATKAKVINE